MSVFKIREGYESNNSLSDKKKAIEEELRKAEEQKSYYTRQCDIAKREGIHGPDPFEQVELWDKKIEDLKEKLKKMETEEKSAK